MNWDFDEMKRLHKENPEEFAAISRDKIYDYIYSIPSPNRREQLMDLQRRIDTELAEYKDPIARMNRMVELFWMQVQLLDDAYKVLVKEETRETPKNVIQFPNKL